MYEVSAHSETTRTKEIVKLLTIACKGGPEDYCSQVFCLSVYEQNFWATNNVGTLIMLPKDMKLYKDQNKTQAFF